MVEDKKIEFTKEDFEFVQNTEKIFDAKFSTKQTTFAKDAFKRFRKNKSSVVAAFIIGTLMALSFIVPLVSPYSIETSDPEKLLRPKLFEAGFGFWDGTKQINNTFYNVHTKETSYKTAGIVQSSLVLTKEGEHFTDSATAGAYGGDLILWTNMAMDATYKNAFGIEFTNTDDFDVVFDFMAPENKESIEGVYGTPSKYSIALEYKTNLLSPVYTLDLVTNSSEIKTQSFNSIDILSQAGVTSITDAKFVITLPNASGNRYVMLDSIKFNANTLTTANLDTVLDSRTIDDVNLQLLTPVTDESYWIGNLSKNLVKANVIKASFLYDEYELVYGNKNETMTTKMLNSYVDKGWIEFDFNSTTLEEANESLKVLNKEECPLIEFTSYEVVDGLLMAEGEVVGYKFMGYSSAPKFIFGTNKSGQDTLTLAFSGLSTSLLIAVTVSAICFTIGIIWGAISGYYGGKIDLLMERFTDVLARVPGMVLITLVILLFGNNVGVFLFALCITGWIGIASTTRTQFYRFKGREYVLVSRTLGAKDRRLIFKHILPNGLGTIITNSILIIPGVITTEAGLAFIGLGLQGTDTIGVMVAENQQLLQTYPMLLVFPATIISLLMISFNLFGNGLRDAVNPSLKGSE